MNKGGIVRGVTSIGCVDPGSGAPMHPGASSRDFEVAPVSRTVGADTIVDELVARFTQSCRMEYFLPGVAPTHRRVELALVVIAHFEGDLLAHEHIYWDHASVLVQVGLLEQGKLPIIGVAGQAGSDAFFQKPVDFQQVAVGLRRIMARDV